MVLLALGCYSPNISDRGYACGDHGECPDHFHCASNHLCYQGDASIDMLAVCNSDATAKEICQAAAATGLCNPSCQTGCHNCGWCAVVGGAATCLTGAAGKKDVGATCDPSKDSECVPGLYCQPESCSAGTVTGTCYRLCDLSNANDTVCGANSACNVRAKTSGGAALPFGLCSLVCDPTSQRNANCPAPFACYPSGATTTECDCAGTKGTGMSCGLAEDCAPGETCVGPMDGTVCRPVCTATVGCAAGTCSIPNGAASGTCM